MRVTEVLGLRGSDFDTRASVAKYRRLKTRCGKKQGSSKKGVKRKAEKREPVMHLKKISPVTAQVGFRP